MESKYRDLKFNSNREFDKWLKETHRSKIRFQFRGQDISEMYLHDTGEILHCDYHASIYNGRFVDISKITTMKPVRITDHDSDVFKPYHGLIIVAFEIK